MSLAGRLEDLSISDIFHILGIGRRSGRLIVWGARGTAVVVFKKGTVTRAEMDDLEGTLGDNLFEAGLVKDTVLNLASEVKKSCPGNRWQRSFLTLAP